MKTNNYCNSTQYCRSCNSELVEDSDNSSSKNYHCSNRLCFYSTKESVSIIIDNNSDLNLDVVII